MLMSAVTACSLVGNGDATLADAGDGAGLQAQSPAGDSNRSVVEVLAPRDDTRPPLDPNADPQTPLGRLRARYFPVWTQEFDGAFPPETCGTAWELDGIAEPVSNVDISLYGEVPVMAALAVMRYEHLVSRALAYPTPLAQLCVAVGSVGPARTAALESLHAALKSGQPGSIGASYPAEATLVAVGPTTALAVACVTTDSSSSSGETPSSETPTPGDASAGEAPSAEAAAHLSAYLLRVSRGHEDRVADTSYRVSDVERRESPDCAGWESWLTQWEAAVNAWLSEGQIWQHRSQSVTVQSICEAELAERPGDCPHDWVHQ